MDILWQILVQFIFRVTFGVSLSMAFTPGKMVTSGYYRVHLWVLMGLNTFAALALFTARDTFKNALISPAIAASVLPLAIVLAVLSYIGAVIWLYEKASLGEKVLFVIALLALVAAAFATPQKPNTSAFGHVLIFLDLASSGLLLGVTLAAMFLGHWYLNTPTMQLVPLKRLVIGMVIAVVVRSLLSAIGLGAEVFYGNALPFLSWVFVGMRWLAGLLGVLMMGLLTWNTLKIPNTQSATGILYAGVILTFIGELTSQLLSVSALYPL